MALTMENGSRFLRSTNYILPITLISILVIIRAVNMVGIAKK